MEPLCPHRSSTCRDVIPMNDCDLPHDTDTETSPWWQHMGLCTVDKVFCSTQVSQIPSYGTQDHPPQTSGFGIWHHSRTFVAPVPLSGSCGLPHAPHQDALSAVWHTQYVFVVAPYSQEHQAWYPQAYSPLGQAAANWEWTLCSYSPSTGHSFPMEANKYPTPVGFPENIVKSSTPADCTVLPVHSNRVDMEWSVSPQLRTVHRKFWTTPYQSSSLDLYGHTKALQKERCSTQKCLGNRLRILHW